MTVASTILVGRGIAQDIDAAVGPHHNDSVLGSDRIESPQERADFIELYRESSPKRRHDLAERFVALHPTSWFLAEAYEAEAKASVDLGLLDRARAEAKLSLELLPENAPLLVPLANVEAKQEFFTEAEEHAKDALEYLDTFDAPSGMPHEAWVKVRAELESSANFALGRIYTTEALGKLGSSRAELLKRALGVLSLALAWTPTDPEVLYLRGVVEDITGAKREAASDLFAAETNGSVMRGKIEPMLRSIYEKQSLLSGSPGPSHPLDAKRATASYSEFLNALPAPSLPALPPTINSLNAPSETEYAGSRACGECHVAEYNRWRQTGMARMLRAYAPENIIGDFEAGTEFHDDSGTVQVGRDTRPFFEIVDRDGVRQKYHVDYTIGSKWQQAYVTRTPSNGLQVLPIQYNLLRKEWVNYWKVLDPPQSTRGDIKRFPELSIVTDYARNCSICHTSRAPSSSSATHFGNPEYREMGINCEMCHGPAGRHVTVMHGKSIVTMPPVDFRTISNKDEINICSQCHRQSLIRDSNYRFDWAVWINQRKIPKVGVSQPYPDFSHLALYKDGRFRQTTFIIEAFTRSACFRKGTARCSSCHNPHAADSGSNPASLKFRENPDQMCLHCHSKDVPRIEQHTHHSAASPGSRCTACHMPSIMDGLMVKAMSHRIDDIPNPEMTARFGQQDSPNACILCHGDKNAAWVSRELGRW